MSAMLISSDTRDCAIRRNLVLLSTIRKGIAACYNGLFSRYYHSRQRHGTLAKERFD